MTEYPANGCTKVQNAQSNMLAPTPEELAIHEKWFNARLREQEHIEKVLWLKYQSIAAVVVCAIAILLLAILPAL